MFFYFFYLLNINYRPNCYARVVSSVLSNKDEESSSAAENTRKISRISTIANANFQNNFNSCYNSGMSGGFNGDPRNKRIIIYSKVLIEKGEELTYDYKFDREVDEKRIQCHCTAKGCRRYLN